jgi:hypothetical protein
MSRRSTVDGIVTWGPSIDRRALAMWPRLDAKALRRCGHDPRRIARLVSHRTYLTIEEIRDLLVIPIVTDDEVATWFG